MYALGIGAPSGSAPGFIAILSKGEAVVSCSYLPWGWIVLEEFRHSFLQSFVVFARVLL